MNSSTIAIVWFLFDAAFLATMAYVAFSRGEPPPAPPTRPGPPAEPQAESAAAATPFAKSSDADGEAQPGDKSR